MSSIKVDVKGVKPIRAKLSRPLTKVLKPAMSEACEVVIDYMADYPPKPAQSSYRRTGTLGRRWAKKVMSKVRDVIGVVYNVTKYAAWVQDFKKQVWYHRRTGWRTDEDAKRKLGKKLNNIFARAIGKLYK